MADTETRRTELLDEFSSSLDSSLVLAILYDYDLSILAELKEARKNLQTLKEEIGEPEQQIVFERDEAGLLGVTEHGYGVDADRSGSGSKGWSDPSDETSVNHGMSSLDFETFSSSDSATYGSEDKPFGAESDILDEEGKIKLLATIFPTLKAYDIQYSLKKAKLDLNTTVDELMTQSFLEGSVGKVRGVDAFSRDGEKRATRKRKGKKKKNISVDDSITSPTTPSSPSSKWDTGKQDIEFISLRTAVPIAQVSAIYHKNGASAPATIAHIIESHQALKSATYDPVLRSRAIDLAHEFTAIPSSSLEALVQITNPAIQYARELAKALEIHPDNSKPLIDVKIRHAPLNLDSAPGPSASRGKSLSLEKAAENAAKYSEQRNINFQKASQASRRGKSDHLMGAVAAYYSQQGRDADALARSARSDVADALVAKQTSRTELDLHGMNVNDAKRITKERVTTWYHELGTTEGGRPVTGSRYHIITGVGHHSNGGVSKLGPAVCRMLVKDGWKVEVQPGRVFVLGPAQAVKKR